MSVITPIPEADEADPATVTLAVAAGEVELDELAACSRDELRPA